MKPSSLAQIAEALHAIKNRACDKCGAQAKGFVYQKKQPVYYCRECLHEQIPNQPRLVA